MTTQQIISDSDPVHASDLRSIAELEGTVVSMTVPTHRAGPDTVTDRNHLREHIRNAVEENPEVEPLLEGAQKLYDDEQFWQQQCDALVVYSSEAGTRYFRTPADVQPTYTIGAPNLRPLLRIAAADEQGFIILAVSQNKVRLFEATAYEITEIDLGEIPPNLRDSVHDTREPQFQHQTGRSAPAHGHDTGEEDALEGFLKEVGKLVANRYATDKRPVVVASVAEYAGTLSPELSSINLSDVRLDGNPDELSPRELHDEIWPQLREQLAATHISETSDRFGVNEGSDNTTQEISTIVRSAQDARIDTLVLTDDALTGDLGPTLDPAIVDTLKNGGSISYLPNFENGATAGAILRF